MKHRNLNHSTCHKAGYNPPNPPVSKVGGKEPHKQPFNTALKKGGK